MTAPIDSSNELDLVAAFSGSLLERAFPYREVSLVSRADRRSKDPVYGAHRWWARRPPALLRAALLAAALPAGTTEAEFWSAYGDGRTALEGWRVNDPFAGGGSTLVEAARLGAEVAGGDVDPLAVEIIRYELDPAPASELRAAGSRLLAHLRSTLGHFYPTTAGRQTLHYFWLHKVVCPQCGESGVLYRNLVLARDDGRVGAVVRETPLTVFCPDGMTVHHLDDPDRVELRLRRRRWPIYAGTYSGGRYTCPECGARSTHSELQTGCAERHLVAVEETADGGRRRIRRFRRDDLDAIEQSTSWLRANRHKLNLPRGALSESRQDARPRSYGIENPAELFTDRQLSVLGSAFHWLELEPLDERVSSGLQLAISNALATNNRLCGWATDYGRLSALFSVRGYSLPALAVELNPLHVAGGRGTIHNCIERVARAGESSVRRHTWSTEHGRAVQRAMTLPTAASTTNIACSSAQSPPAGGGVRASVCIFDPPYFDYIAYDELSEFYRVWRGLERLSGDLPTSAAEGDAFGIELGVALRSALARLEPGRLLAFTYHSTNHDAWRAVATAIDEAKMRVTALWPIFTDGHMGHHSFPGNCEWDLLVVCRRVTETVPAVAKLDVDAWAESVQPLRIGEADTRSMKLAIEVASSRFGRVSEGA